MKLKPAVQDSSHRVLSGQEAADGAGAGQALPGGAGQEGEQALHGGAGQEGRSGAGAVLRELLVAHPYGTCSNCWDLISFAGGEHVQGEGEGCRHEGHQARGMEGGEGGERGEERACRGQEGGHSDL